MILSVVLALVAGGAIAWVDSRPGWDDTGVTAGLLFLAALLCALPTRRWYVVAIVVALPLIVVERRSIGTASVVVLGIAMAGAAVGSAIGKTRRPSRPVST
jgi:hypothetical protein